MSSNNEGSIEGQERVFAPPPEVETVNEEIDNDPEGSEMGASLGTQSFVSGAAGGTGEVLFHDLIHMVGDDYCRVLIRGQRGGVDRICGHPFGECPRKHHQVLCKNDDRRGGEGYFLGYQTSGGVVDGLANRPYTEEEVATMHADEMDRAAGDLSGLNNGFEEDPLIYPHQQGDPTLPPPITESPMEMPGLEDVGPPEEGMRNAPVAPGRYKESGMVTETPSPGRVFGLESLDTGDRLLETDMDTIQDLRLVGFTVRRTFTSPRDAHQWKTDGVSVEGLRRGTKPPQLGPALRGPRSVLKKTTAHPRPVTPLEEQVHEHRAPTPMFYGMENPKTGGRMVAASRSEVDHLADMGYALKKLFEVAALASAWEEMRGLDDMRLPPPGPPQKRAHETRVGPDRSKTEQEVFELNIDYIDQVDKMCLPGEVSMAEADQFYDCATDVLALPGGYRASDREGEDDQEDMATALLTLARGQKQAHKHMRYGSRSQHGLRAIKAGEDVGEFMDNVHDTWAHAETSMRSEFTRTMYQAGYTQDDTESYLQNGVLPRVIQDTYRAYTYFLGVMMGHVNKASPGTAWKDTVAGNFLNHHSKKLMIIRERSSCYRELVLRNYAYLRENQKDSFWTAKLGKTMAEVTLAAVARSMTTGGGNGAPQGATTTASKWECPTCRRSHSGRPCPTAPLSMTNRTKLGGGMKQRQYEKALKVVKEMFSNDPHVSHDTVVEAARLAALS